MEIEFFVKVWQESHEMIDFLKDLLWMLKGKIIILIKCTSRFKWLALFLAVYLVNFHLSNHKIKNAHKIISAHKLITENLPALLPIVFLSYRHPPCRYKSLRKSPKITFQYEENFPFQRASSHQLSTPSAKGKTLETEKGGKKFHCDFHAKKVTSIKQRLLMKMS